MSFQSRLFATAILSVLAASCAAAQGATAQAGPAPTKIAVVDIRQAVQASAEGKLAAAELQSQFSPKQAELENMQKGLEELQTRLSTGARTLSDEERVRLQRQGEHMNHQFQRKQQELEEEINAAQQDVFERMGKKMVEVISRYARENSYGVILDASTACGVFCSNQLDVTQDIIRLYDQANPVKAGSGTPAQPRPAAGRPASQPAATTPAKPKPPR